MKKEITKVLTEIKTETHSKLKTYAYQSGKTLGDVVREALNEYINNHIKEV